jgi:hypothetical protein
MIDKPNCEREEMPIFLLLPQRQPIYLLTNILSPSTVKPIPATVHSREQISPTITPHHIAGGNTVQRAIAAFNNPVVDRLINNPNPKTPRAHRSHMFSLLIVSIISAFVKPSQESGENLNVS